MNEFVFSPDSGLQCAIILGHIERLSLLLIVPVIDHWCAYFMCADG